MNKLVATFKKIAMAAVAFGTAALCATSVHAGGFNGKPLATNDWFDVGFTNDDVGQLTSTTGIPTGKGSWTHIPSGGAEVVSDSGYCLIIDTDGNDPLTLTPAALPNTVSNETISVEVLATPSTDELEDPIGSPISAFALRDDGSAITPVAYVAGGWTNLVYSPDAEHLTNAWFTLYTDFATVGDTKYLRFSIKPANGTPTIPANGTPTILEDSTGETWFPAATNATNISSVSLTGSTSCRTISGDALFDAVASANGTNYATFAEAITAAEAYYTTNGSYPTITVLNGATEQDNPDWTIDNGNLVHKPYVAAVIASDGVTTNDTYTTIQAAIAAAQAGETVAIFAGTYDLGNTTITVNKSITITGEGKSATTLNFTASGKAALSLAANNVTIRDMKITQPSADNTYIISVPRGGSQNNYSIAYTNVTMQALDLVGGKYAINVTGDSFAIKDCDLSGQTGSAQIEIYSYTGDSVISNCTFVGDGNNNHYNIMHQGGNDGSNLEGIYSSGTLKICDNKAKDIGVFYVFNQWGMVDTTEKMNLIMTGNFITNTTNKGVNFYKGGANSDSLGALFNEITITNNAFFVKGATGAVRPVIRRDDGVTTGLTIDANYNYWGSADPDFSQLAKTDNGVTPVNIDCAYWYNSYDTETGVLSDLRPLPSPVVTFVLRDEVGDMTIQYDSSVYTIHTQDGVERSGAAVYNYMTQTVANGGLATEPTGEPSYWYHSGKTFPVGNNTGIPFTVEQSQAYVFDGWRLSGENMRYDFSTPVTSDITLVPHFSAVEAVFEIYTEEDLFAFAREVALGRSYRSKVGGAPRQTVRLMNNITLTSNWTPIPGNFHGIFDGNGYAISGLVINDTTNEETGFFRTSGKSGNSFVVTDLTFQNPSVTSTGSFVGVLVGQADCVSVTNVMVNNPTVLSTSTDNVGGLVGSVNNNVPDSASAPSVFSGCSVNGGTISCTGSDGRMVGGLIGQGLRYLAVTNCSVSDVTINGYRKLGGLIGQANGTHLTCTDASVSGVTLNALGNTSYAKDLTMGGLVGQFATPTESTFTGTVSDLTMTGPESIASGKNYVMGWVSGGTGGTVAAAETAMSGASMAFDVTVSGTNTRTVPNDSTYAGINGNKVGYSEGDTQTFVFGEGEEDHELTATEADYLNSIIASNGCTKTELETALAGMTVEEFKDAALLNIDITEMSSPTYAKPDFNITAIKRFRDSGQQKVKVTVKLDRHGSEVSQPINGVLQLKTSPDGKDGNWRVLSEVEISDDNFSEGSESDFILSAEGADHIFKATVVERPSASND